MLIETHYNLTELVTLKVNIKILDNTQLTMRLTPAMTSVGGKW